MKYYDEQLQQLQEKIARMKQLDEKSKELRGQREELASRVRELKTIKMSEQSDVDQLEGRSLASFFYNVIGKKDEKLSKEREEAYAARVKYDAAARELEAIDEDWQRCVEQLSELRGCDQQYAKILKEKADAVKAAGGETAEEILKLEENYASLSNWKKELREAINAGNTALSTANSVLASLDSAEKLGRWDMVLDGGMITDMAKHRHLDAAQSNVERLQSQLRRFKTELADVMTIRADMQVNVEGFLRFADYFFDGLFVDWAVLDRIGRAKNEVLATVAKIRKAVSQLNYMEDKTDQEQARLKDRIDTLVRNAG